jgi:hypothetical protein
MRRASLLGLMALLFLVGVWKGWSVSVSPRDRSRGSTSTIHEVRGGRRSITTIDRRQLGPISLPGWCGIGHWPPPTSMKTTSVPMVEP